MMSSSSSMEPDRSCDIFLLSGSIGINHLPYTGMPVRSALATLIVLCLSSHLPCCAQDTSSGFTGVSLFSEEEIQDYRLRSFQDNLHDANYFLMPSARPYIPGYGLYRNQLLLINSIGYGFSKNLSASIGMEAASLFRDEQVFFGTGKFSAEIAGNVYVAAGALYVTTESAPLIEQGFAALTFGDQELNISLGMSAVHYFDLDDVQITYNAGLFYQLADLVGIMSENHLIPSKGQGLFYLGIHGVRIISGDSGIDIGLALNTEQQLGFQWTVLPFLGYSLLF